MQSFLTLTTPPETEPVTLEEARAHLRIDALDGGSPPSHPDDTLVTSLITAVRQHLDGVDGWLGRALTTQVYTLYLTAFPSEWGQMQWPYATSSLAHWERANPSRPRNAIVLPLPPLQSVASVKYIDSNGVLQTMSIGDYKVYDKAMPAFITPAYGNAWPSARWQPDAVQVEFTAGYGDSGSDVPMPIRQGMLLLLSHLYENREAVIVSTGRAVIQELPRAVDALLFPYRVYR